MTIRKEFRKDTIVEAFTQCIPTLPEEHILIHGGYLWDIQHYASNVGSDESAEVFLQTSNTRQLLHMLFTFSSSLPAEFFIYENTDKAYVAGNILTPVNRNRYEGTQLAAPPTICHTPSGSGDGDLLFRGILGGGAGRQGSLGSVGRDANELLLGQNKKYLLRLTSLQNANRLLIGAEYYERFHFDAVTTTTTV